MGEEVGVYIIMSMSQRTECGTFPQAARLGLSEPPEGAYVAFVQPWLIMHLDSQVHLQVFILYDWTAVDYTLSSPTMNRTAPPLHHVTLKQQS